MKRRYNEIPLIVRFCINSILFECNAESIDLAYKLTRSKETSATDPDVVHRMALRWLRTDEDVLHYIEDCGYIADRDTNGEKHFHRNLDDPDLVIK